MGLRHMFLVLFVGAFVLTPATQAANTKTTHNWTIPGGRKTVNGSFAGVERTFVKIMTEKNQTVRIPFRTLTSADREHLRALLGDGHDWQLEGARTKVKGQFAGFDGDRVAVLTADDRLVQLQHKRLTRDNRRHIVLKVALTEEDRLVGSWVGLHVSDHTTWQHRFEIARQGTKLVMTDTVWRGLTTDQVAAAKRRRLRNAGPYPFSAIGEQQYDVLINDGKVELKGKRVRIVYLGPGYLKGTTWKPDTFTLTPVAPGYLVGTVGDAKTKQNRMSIYFAREELWNTPLTLELELGKTHHITCQDDSRYHYSLYLPPKYDHARPSPVLINDSPGGNAKPLTTKMADELGWIMVGLKESSNGGVMQTAAENCAAVIFDLHRRVRVDSKRYYFSGFSGGSRRSAWRGVEYAEQCAGIFCIGAGYRQWTSGDRRGHYMVPPLHLPIYMLIGRGDKLNFEEVTKRVHPMAKKNRRTVIMKVHDGGHVWGEPALHETAVRWLDDQWQR